ncbi:MAG: alpha/beta hydrolase, partial [Gammaproteobacteria bacterium]|nr:alpha/beta hydrolase [Gammaproteobacteria bacterium]
ILRGIFLGSQSEIDWIYEDIGCAHFHPEAYHELINELDTKNGVVSQYYEKLKKNDGLFAEKWSVWEAMNSGINVTEQTIDLFKEPNLAMSLSKISAHFFYNHLFLKPNYILDNINKIQHIKTTIVQGQHDLLCPPKTALTLKNNMDDCNLYIIPDAGHSLFEPSLLKKVISLLNEIKV